MASISVHEKLHKRECRGVSHSGVSSISNSSFQTKGSGASNLPNTSSTSTLLPTWHGFIHTTADALQILEGCLNGKLHHIPRRPHDRERPHIIASGNVFIYEENASGIKRWTDGVTWSPSRIMNNFLVYRELNEPFPAGEKKKAKKRKRSSPNGDAEIENSNAQTEEDRKLVGSLVDSYGFKRNGLIKKTLNIKLHGVNHHIVSYYNLPDVKENKYHRPQLDPVLNALSIRQELLNYGFKAPIHDVDEIDPFRDQQQGQPTMPSPVALVPVGQDSPQSAKNMHISTDSPISYTGSPVSYHAPDLLDGTTSTPLVPSRQPSHTSIPPGYSHPSIQQYISQAPLKPSIPAGYTQPAQFNSQPQHYASPIARYTSHHQSQYLPPSIQYYSTPNHHLPPHLSRQDPAQSTLTNQPLSLDYLPYSMPQGVRNTSITAGSAIVHHAPSEHQYQIENEFDNEYPDPWAVHAPLHTTTPAKRRQTAPVGSISTFGNMLSLGANMDGYGYPPPMQYPSQTPIAVQARTAR
ncbi:hypothetical protein EJ08DRAFT_693244 [Tothia fuscella]|uniref:Uncharacterized protein n=1 Tax=Tothia fuscella TaxID=1048955 RepID=A0A9P4NZZ1_9PEZI|nr:hypothetical protein EJ08DRAFT_693244 [Tothia fuscella]